MRLFQHQNVYSPFDNPTPAPPPPPPFLTDTQEEKSLCLLRESTTHLREGRQRLSTPDKVAIMELSSSFDKKRLGKQQQILSEITQRCREQEVTDLSSKITAKVLLKHMGEEDSNSPSIHTSSQMRLRMSRGRSPEGPSFSPGGGFPKEKESIERRLKFEKGYKFFPARRIIRQPSHIQYVQTPTGTKDGGGGGGWGDTGTTARMNTDPIDPEPRGQTADHTITKGPNAIQSYLQPKLDAVPPLLLADLHCPSAADGEGHPDRVGYCFSSSRLPLSQRSRTYFDTSRSNSRNFNKNLPAGSRHAASRHQIKSMRSQRGLHSMLQEIFTDMDIGSTVRKPAPYREVPIDLKTVALAPRRVSQKI